MDCLASFYAVCQGQREAESCSDGPGRDFRNSDRVLRLPGQKSGSRAESRSTSDPISDFEGHGCVLF